MNYNLYEPVSAVSGFIRELTNKCSNDEIQ